MATLKIDDTEYELDLLSAEAKAQLVSLQMTDSEIQRLQVQLAIAQTARNAYANALKSLLPTPRESSQKSDTLKVS